MKAKTGAGERAAGRVLLAAGGTGGHLFPAFALAEELNRRGFDVHLASDHRVKEHGGRFPAKSVDELPAATVSLRKPWRLPGQAVRLWRGYGKARDLIARLEPDCVVGFGGYPSFAPLVAAWRQGVASVIHDQNAVMGRANRALAPLASVIAASFPDMAGVPARAKHKVVLTGNPVRDKVAKLAGTPYEPAGPGKVFTLVVFGGSQGARFFSQFMPETVARLSRTVQKRLRIIQQCRAEDIDAVAAAYDKLGVKARVDTFFTDLPKLMARAQLVICRSGASSIAELAVLGRPAILVPLPHSIDGDQTLNARQFAAAGGGWVMAQESMEPENVAAFLTRLRYAGDELASMASCSASFGRANAAALLADQVETLICAHRNKQPAREHKAAKPARKAKA